MAEKVDIKMMAFVDAVKNMRRLQKEYFATRDPHTLTEARRTERLVDRLLDEIDEQTLF